MRAARGAWPPVLLGAAFLAAFAGPALADRPLQTEDTGTLEPGKPQVEVGLDYARNPDDKAWTAKATLNLGLLPRLEGKLEIPIILLEPDDRRSRGGFGDVEIGAKYRFVDEAPRVPAVLGALAIRLPTGDEDRGLGEADVDVRLLAGASKAFGPATLTGNGGYTFITRDRDLDTVLLRGSLEYELTKAWTLVGEVVSALGIDRARDEAVLRVGAVWSASARVRLDGGIGFGLSGASPDVLVTVGLTLDLF